MKINVTSLVLVLAVTAISCGLPSTQPSSELQNHTSGGKVQAASITSTPTTKPSSTHTDTPVPPTKTAKPTNTPTPRVATVKIKDVGSNVIIREGPCYQTPLAHAKPGSVFPAIGWYRSPAGEEWLVIEFRDRNNSIHEGWVRADLVEVTNSDLVNRAFGNCPPTKTPTPSIVHTIAVYRWFHPGDKDWVTIPDGSIADSVLRSYGYQDKTFLFYAWKEEFKDAVAVNRWFHPGDKDWVTITKGSIKPKDLERYGYQEKTFLFYASSKPVEAGVAVYRWFHPGGKDWVDIPEGSIADNVLRSHGYQDKTFLFYAATRL